MSTDPHVNERYEYTTREYPYTSGSLGPDEPELTAGGWRRAWADITQDGIFVVYRRERAAREA
jgi:hypothetical protein